MKLPIHRIIPFSNVEGIGNRTSIFLQGCNINCLYCHNSETIPKKYAPHQLMSLEDLLDVVNGNMPFIRGITVSGGEPTLYHKALTELFTQVHNLGLTCYIDTNGFFDRHQINDLIEATDKFLFDVKAIGKELEPLCFSKFAIEDPVDEGYKQRFALCNEHMDNLAYLLEKDKVEEVRYVYTKGYSDPKLVVEGIVQHLKHYPEVGLKIIRVHSRGLPLERMKALKGAIPNLQELEDLGTYARELGIENVVTIG